MKIYYLPLFLLLLVSCQSSKEREQEKIAKGLAQVGYDTENVKELEILQHKQRQFCECLVNDSLSNVQKL